MGRPPKPQDGRRRDHLHDLFRSDRDSAKTQRMEGATAKKLIILCESPLSDINN